MTDITFMNNVISPGSKSYFEVTDTDFAQWYVQFDLPSDLKAPLFIHVGKCDWPLARLCRWRALDWELSRKLCRLRDQWHLRVLLRPVLCMLSFSFASFSLAAIGWYIDWSGPHFRWCYWWSENMVYFHDCRSHSRQYAMVMPFAMTVVLIFRSFGYQQNQLDSVLDLALAWTFDEYFFALNANQSSLDNRYALIGRICSSSISHR